MHATQNNILFRLTLASDFQSLYMKAFILDNLEIAFPLVKANAYRM